MTKGGGRGVAAGVRGRCWVAMLASMVSFEAPGALPGCGFGVLACGYVRDSTRAAGKGVTPQMRMTWEENRGRLGRRPCCGWPV